ncbi:MAG TPA: DUF4328 domain-containing protein [candidate division Zixibacteria bacterium]|nr:DUF4328 domain-containing protein [candidate division Zixibacteria bacterium]MDD4917898.1 DUF4328 domain-containing protein [candidate division Zixibacteria bacterium]MDM7973490.1 DUF4328 domain-containing protein [candidate division Zixibacteria bacterium]HOD66218.1 DUF4328 domain-containing protein [candidate division Zixibacteria bacterium]HOZ07486.1 DUF4328 domain-containing protein [candidate division Zixibacteria bacterium]
MTHPQGPPPYPTQAYTAGYGDAAGSCHTYAAPPPPGYAQPLSARGRAVATVYALGVTLLFHLISIPLLLWENSLVQRYGMAIWDGGIAEGEFGAWGLVTFGNALFLIAATVTTVVLFLMWIHRAYRVLEVNKVAGLKATAGWAVGWWFIPIANLVKPFEVTKEIFVRSERPPAGGAPWGAGPTPAPAGFVVSTAQSRESSWIVGAWWLTWLAASFATNLSGFLSGAFYGLGGNNQPTAEQYVRGNLLDIGATVLFILAGVLAIMVVRDIDRRQHRAFSQQPAPLPPSAWPR